MPPNLIVFNILLHIEDVLKVIDGAVDCKLMRVVVLLHCNRQ